MWPGCFGYGSERLLFQSKIEIQKSPGPGTFPPVADTLVVNEIYLSLQGESPFAGLPCVFIRLTACNLRCSYCDTAYAFTEGKQRVVTEVLAEVKRLAEPYQQTRIADCGLRNQTEQQRLPLVELTGGEPLLQKNCLPLMRM